MYDEKNMMDRNATFEFISLVAGQQSFCIELHRIREIRRWEPITMLPHSPDFVLGVVNLRGAVVPIVDLASKLGFKKIKPTKRNVIIISNYGEQVTGFLVESVSEILNVKSEEVKEPPNLNDNLQYQFICGLISSGDDMIRVIDLDSLMFKKTSEVLDD